MFFTMDISIGSYRANAPLLTRAQSVYARLTTRAKGLLALLMLALLYLLWPSSTTSTSSVQTATSQSLSTTLNSGAFHRVSLSYMGLPPLLDASGAYPNYANGGNMLLSRKSDYVRLVGDRSERNGFLTSHTAISYADLSAFEVEIHFRIHGMQERSTLVGDGMALWLTSDPIHTGDVFGAAPSWDGLGIFLDTYKNFNGKRNRNLFPYLSLQRNRGDPSFYDKGTDGLDSQLGGCSMTDVYNNEGVSALRVAYVRALRVLEVSADVHGDGNWSVCFRRENDDVADYLPMGRGVYLSVSAETGQLHHNVDVYSLKVTSYRTLEEGEVKALPTQYQGIQGMGNVDQNDESASPNKPTRRTMKRLRRQERKLREMDREKYGTENGFVGWFAGLLWTVFKRIFQLALVLVALYACLLGYRVWREKSRKNRGGLL